MKKLLYFSLFLIVFSCQPDRGDSPIQVMGLAPIYASSSNVNAVGIEAVRATTNPGKIYAYANFLFQVEQYQGIHIIDNTNPAQARKVGFIQVPMATEIAIKSDHLYTNNVNDLVVFRLQSSGSVQLVSRIKDAFPVIDQVHPTDGNTYFECVDPSKGVVVGWERKMLNQPKCRR
jgi:hypothetical protein